MDFMGILQTNPDGTESATVFDNTLMKAIMLPSLAAMEWATGKPKEATDHWNLCARLFAGWDSRYDKNAVITLAGLYATMRANAARSAELDTAALNKALMALYARPASDRDPEFCAELVKLGNQLLGDGVDRIAYPMLASAKSMVAGFRPVGHPERRTAAYAFGNALGAAGSLDAALAEFTEAVGNAPTDEASLGLTIGAMSARASTLFRLTRVDEAIAVGLKLLDLTEQTKGTESPEYAVAAGDVGMMYRHIGDARTAERMLERAVRLLEPHSPRYDGPLGRFLSNLSVYVNARGERAMAAAMLERALGYKEHAHGPESPEVADSLQKLAATLASDGRFREARTPATRALAIRTTRLGAEHADTRAMVDLLRQIDADLEKQSSRSGHDT
jgi:tetratricopeptide (TPR) repeat protein